MKYYLIAGEPSGDLHGSNLIKGLLKADPEARLRFWGGDLMAAAGGEANLAKHYRETSFFGIVQVLKNLRTIKRQMRECRADVAAFAPDVLILVDYPGFNMKMARWAKEHGIRTFYYIAPKVWAWREWRVKAIRRWVDRLFVIFPFECGYFPRHGDATYRYWEPGDGWFIYPMEREAVGEDFNASFYSTPRYELFKQGIRDVAKAKYLLNSESATAEEKTELTDVVEHLAKPQKGTYQGSAVAASEKDRMLVHSETERALDATNALARNVAERENPNPKPESADKTALNAAIKDAEALKKEDYTAESWKAFETALNAAKETAADKDAAQTEVDNALNVLNAAVAKLEKVKDPNQQQPVQPQPEQTKPDKTTPQTGDRTNAALLFGCAVLSGAGVFFAYRRRRTIK